MVKNLKTVAEIFKKNRGAQKPHDFLRTRLIAIHSFTIKCIFRNGKLFCSA